MDYSDENRGKIQNRARRQQIIDASGLRYGKCTGTDLDLFFDFKNKLFVLVEIKHGDAPIPFGQSLALERLCDASAVPCVLIHASHSVADPAEDIDAGEAIVRRMYCGGRWINTNPITTKAMMDKILKAAKIVYN